MVWLVIVGLIIGMFIMWLMNVNKDIEVEELKNDIKWFGNHIALIIYKENRLGNKDVGGMKQIQELYEKYFEEEMK